MPDHELPLSAPMQECDLIMKGGITSGVVYPQAVVRIAQHYRLRSIGGSSAGAIAATFAAAAEYRRQSGGGMTGYDRISALSAELAASMKDLFQPRPAPAPLFELLLGAVSGTGVLRTGMRVFRSQIATAAAVLVVLLGLAAIAESFWAGAAATLAVAMGLALWIGRRLARMVLHELPAANFGICPGKTQAGHAGPALTDWMDAHINEIAGKPPEDGPLTTGELSRHGIEIAAMTTDLSTQRPYQLPLMTRIHYFSLAEWQALFSDRFLAALTNGRTPLEHGQADAPRDLYQLPVGAGFPVLLVARMSLSFPGLIDAVPLWRHDDQLRQPGRDGKTVGRLSRCLFSDGGISSNFPIHFFDALLPSRPTFGIALDSWDAARHGADRVCLPARSPVSTDLPVRPITGLGSFLMAILNTAKDWQDTLQAMLPGYAERVVTVRLDDSAEGGMNLTMPPDVIASLTELGEKAGQALCDRYSYAAGTDGFDKHRQLRGRVVVPKLGEALADFGAAMAAAPAGAVGAPTGRQTLEAALSTACMDLADDLAAIDGGDCAARRVSDSTIRLAAMADRVPRSAETA